MCLRPRFKACFVTAEGAAVAPAAEGSAVGFKTSILMFRWFQTARSTGWEESSETPLPVQ